MDIYYYNPNTGAYLCKDIADTDPLEGKPLIPANATHLEPPETTGIERAVFVDGAWSVDSDWWEEKLAAQIRARLDAVDLKSIRPQRAIQAGTGTTEDTARLAELEEHASGLRAMLTDEGFPWTPDTVAWPSESA